MRDLHGLEVWRKSRTFVAKVYEATSRFPDAELFGLTSQLRRASVSICANIAEGAGRGTDGEFARFLRIALGSATEVWTLIVLCTDLGLLAPTTGQELQVQSTELRRMLTSLTLNVSRDSARGKVADR